MYHPNLPRVKDQGRTKNEPGNDLRTPKRKKVHLLRLPSLLLLLYFALFHRPTTEGTPKEVHMTKKALFLRLSPKKVDLIPKKVVSLPKKVDSFPEKVDIAHQPLKKNALFFAESAFF